MTLVLRTVYKHPQSSDWVVMIPNWNGALIVVVVDLLSVCFTRLEMPTRGV